MISVLDRIRKIPYSPFLAQLVVTRRCNLKCGYCNEFDDHSEPVPFDVLMTRMAKIRDLGTLGLELTGGEPLMHPQIVRLVAEAKSMGFVARWMISNAYLLNESKVHALNAAGLTDMQISIDGVEPNEVTIKVLRPLRSRLEMLARLAKFRVTLSAVIGAAPPEEVREVVRFAKEQGFKPRVLLLHDGEGTLMLNPENIKLFRDLQEYLGSGATEAHGYRTKLVQGQKAPFKCRAGSRYIYVDEDGQLLRCSQTRKRFSRDLLSYSDEDLKEQFNTYKPCNPYCTLGCARTNSKLDEWRKQALGR